MRLRKSGGEEDGKTFSLLGPQFSLSVVVFRVEKLFYLLRVTDFAEFFQFHLNSFVFYKIFIFFGLQALLNFGFFGFLTYFLNNFLTALLSDETFFCKVSIYVPLFTKFLNFLSFQIFYFFQKFTSFSHYFNYFFFQF